MSEHKEDQVEQRLAKLGQLRALGIDPYGKRFAADAIGEILADYREERAVRVTGRLMSKRGHGGLSFADIQEGAERIQLCIRKNEVGPEAFRLWELLDLGDIIGVEGRLFTTKTGQITVQVLALQLLSKALRPLPDKWHGLQDIETRYRKRYLDLTMNQEARAVFVQRAKMLSVLRGVLEGQGFLEVETPMMHLTAGGAAGEPFITHHKALDLDLSMRLAPELFLKKLLVGGLGRVYELNRSFRNEGLSTRHNPEFTMLEVYAAYQDGSFMMDLVQQLFIAAAQALRGSLTLEYQGQPIDLNPPWEVVSFAQVMQDMGLHPQSTLEEMQAVLSKRGIKVKGQSRSQLVRLVEQLFEPQTKTKPLFVVDYWTEVSPLARSKPENPAIADRFELFIGGMEVANAYSELNDPVEQRRRFTEQIEGHVAPDRKLDTAFLDALEHGMPPAGGLGVGIDRLAMILLNQPSIKDVILFPLLRPLDESQAA
jgi:lysyl-tRNA synthetase class 2